MLDHEDTDCCQARVRSNLGPITACPVQTFLWSCMQHYQGLRVAARDLLRFKVAKRQQLLDTEYTVCRHITLAYANALHDEVNACCSKHDHSEPQSREYDHMREIEKVVEFQEMDPADVPVPETYSTPAPGRVFHAAPAPVIEYVAPTPVIADFLADNH